VNPGPYRAAPYSLGGQIAIAGIAEYGCGKSPGETVLSLQSKAAHAALADAGLSTADIDGLYVSGYPYAERPSVLLSEYLGIHPAWTDSTNVGGCGFVMALEHAGAAIQAGLCRTVLVSYGSTQYSSRLRRLGGRAPEFSYQFEVPYGLPLPLGGYALAAQRHMYEFGTTSEQLAQIAVAARGWAALNDLAPRKEQLTVDDVLSSPVIATPLHALDCCLVTDGAGAVIVTSAERARDLRQPVVTLAGSGYAHSHETITSMADLTTTAAVSSGGTAFARAGLTPADIDVLHLYDSFTITVLLALEDLGFCAKGEGGAFVSGGRIAPGGELAVNTSGGGLSYCHPGMFGIFLVVEAVRQLRGTAGARQVPGAERALCHGVGGQLSTAATAILERSR
jgi:acetyl-CoA acetyltransferase